MKLTLEKCKYLPMHVNVNKSNDRERYQQYNENCEIDMNICKKKYKSNDCVNEYYSMKTIFNDDIPDKKLKDLSKYPKHNSNLVTTIYIEFVGDSDTIYTHSPEQYFVEFACYIAGVIALWTGVSVMSLYAYTKRFFMRKFAQTTNLNQKTRQKDFKSPLFARNSNLNQIVTNNYQHNQPYFIN